MTSHLRTLRREAGPSAHPDGRPAATAPGAQSDREVREVLELAITGLSELGFELGAVTNLVHGPALEKVMTTIEHVDELISGLRGLLLNGPDRAPVPGELRHTIQALVENAGHDMGSTPRLDIDGDLERLSPPVARHLRAVVVEAVRNAVAHSGGSHLEVQITVDGDEVRVSVTDDGVGPPQSPVHGLGLGRMAALARELDGTFVFAPGATSGTRVGWYVPLGAGPGPAPGPRREASSPTPDP